MGKKKAVVAGGILRKKNVARVKIIQMVTGLVFNRRTRRILLAPDDALGERWTITVAKRR